MGEKGLGWLAVPTGLGIDWRIWSGMEWNGMEGSGSCRGRMRRLIGMECVALCELAERV